MSGKLQAHLFLFLANLIYGVSFTIAKDVVPHYIGPFGAIVIRVSVSLLLFFFVYLLFIREKIYKKDIPLLTLCGLFGVAMNQLLFFKGLSITTPINAALIMTTTPIMVVAISYFTGRDYMNPWRLLGIALGIVGALTIILYGKDVEFTSSRSLGDLCIFLNAASYAVYIVIVKPLMSKYHPITIITMVFLFGNCIVIPVGFQQFMQIHWQTLPTLILAELAFIVIATTFLAYLFNILAMQHASPGVVGIYIYSQPAIASIFALLMQKDSFSWEKALATILIFTGVYLVSFAGKKQILTADK
jgi:drug/metabolite transporter (DMT)-like permease